MALNAFLPLNLPLQAETTKYPFKLSMTAEKRQSETGELVDVTWTLTNIVNINITLFTSIDRYDFTIYDVDFNRVFHYGAEFTFAAVIQEIGPISPGNKTGWRGSWDETYGRSADIRPELRQMKAPPGVYYLVGSFDSPTYNITLQAPPIRIKIKGG